jgi:thiol-disulfide isomerase/thioredoxin
LLSRVCRGKLTPGRLLDAIAIAVIAFVGWKIFIAPRALSPENAYPAPHVSYARLDGGTFVLQHQRGKLVFLDFYASWCTPCRIELPLVERYARAHPEVEVVPVDVGEPRNVAAIYAKRLNLRGVVLDPHTRSQGSFEIRGFPTIVVVDPKGRIRATWPGLNPAIDLAMSNAEQMLTKPAN